MKIFLKEVQIYLVLALIILASCSVKEYQSFTEMRSKELGLGAAEDSLFLGYYLGMSKQAFYDRCYQLHDDEIVDQGNIGRIVLFKLKDPIMKGTVNFQFFPKFTHEKITQMDVIVDYPDWAPWNQNLSKDSLFIRTQLLINHWYKGNSFVKLTQSEFPQGLIKKDFILGKVDKSRQILLYPYMGLKYAFTITDLEKHIAQQED